VQPVIRYDLGDSVVALAGTCACGSPLPAIRVEGRCDDVVRLTARNGRKVSLLPLALTTVVEEAVDIHRYQLVQRGHDRLALRLAPGDADTRKAVWHDASAALRGYLAAQSLGNVKVVLDRMAPAPNARSGKLTKVIAEERPAPHLH